MKLVVGLGNVGAQYANTRHNAGFMIVDRLAELLAASSWRTEAKFKGAVTEATSTDGRVILLKPSTLMNLSGEAVAAVARFYKIDPHDIWIIHDELDVPFGRLRLRRGGSAGGHNGLKSIIRAAGDEFQRVRFGISQNDRSIQPAESYVLSPFSTEERKHLSKFIYESAEVVLEQLAQPEVEETTFELKR
jgi:peptidyl-tRNA hydrolase, PTH1 family